MPEFSFPVGMEAGPLRDLLRELHRLHALAGWPSATELAKDLKCGRSSVHNMFVRPLLPNRTTFFNVIEELAKRARGIDADEWCDKLCELWMSAYDSRELSITIQDALRPHQPSEPAADDTLPTTRAGGINFVVSGDIAAGDKIVVAGDNNGIGVKKAYLSLPEPGRSRALFIGNAVYDDQDLPSLPGLVAGTRRLHEVMTKPTWGAFTRADSIVLENLGTVPVLTAVQAACAEAEDVLFLYYAGHGLLSHEGELLLGTPDTRLPLMEVTALPYARLRDCFARSAARRKVVILDSCFSGRAIASALGPLSGTARMEASTIVLASTGAYSAAFVAGPEDAPAMTRALLEALEHGVVGGSELLDVDTVFDAIKRKLARESFPTPTLQARRSSYRAGNVALGRNPAFRPSV